LRFEPFPAKAFFFCEDRMMIDSGRVWGEGSGVSLQKWRLLGISLPHFLQVTWILISDISNGLKIAFYQK
jgi:hypothetical protein